MTRAKANSKKKPAAAREARPALVSPSALIAGFGRHGGWVLVAAAAGTLALGAGALEDRAGTLRADPVEADFHWPALTTGDRTWLPAGEQRRLRDLLLTSVSLNPGDYAALTLARTRLLESGWFESDLQLVRRPGGVVRVRGTWREPVAVVRSAGSDHVVSASARRLPPTYPAGGAGALRFIAGVWGDPPRPGAVWTGGDVDAAIDLLALLRQSPAWGKVAGIDASRFIRAQMLSVITTDGAEVVWGSGPSDRPTGQVDHLVRLQRFEALMDDPSWAAAGRPRVELHLPRPVINESAVRD